jgi:nitrate/nitrite-specific signal transduction histidine kinase
VGDLWDPNTKIIHPWDDIRDNYSLKEGKKIIWEKINKNLFVEWIDMLTQEIERPKEKKWVVLLTYNSLFLSIKPTLNSSFLMIATHA